MDEPFAFSGEEKRVGVRRKDDRELKVSEQKFKMIFECANDVIIYLDNKGFILDINNKVYETFGYQRYDVIGKHFTKIGFLYSEDIQFTSELFEDFLSGQTMPLLEIEGYHKDGSKTSIEINPTLLKQDGEVIGVLTIIRDISERKRVIKALMDSEARYRELVETINEVFYTTDENGIFNYISPSIKALTGYDPSYYIGKSFEEFIYPEDIPLLKNLLPGILSGETEYTENRLVTKSGNTRWIHASITPIFVEQQLIEIHGLLTDVTDRHIAEEALLRAYEEMEERVDIRTIELQKSNEHLQKEIADRSKVEEALRESEEKFRTIYENVNDEIAYLTVDGTVIDVNGKCQDIFGYTREELIGKNFREFTKFSPEVMKQNEEYFTGLVAGKKPKLLELKAKRKDGTPIYIEVNSRLLKKDGKPQGVLSIIRDSTKRREKEDARREKEKELRNKLSRYVAESLVKILVDSEDGVFPDYERKEVTVLFADIRSFTKITEKLKAEEVVSLLNQFFSTMVDIIFKHNGVLDKFVGDQLMAVFGLIPTAKTGADDAVSAAFEMQEAVIKLNKARNRQNKVKYDIGIGINTGSTVVGNVGAENRMDYTVIGDSVNIAAKLEKIASGGEIIIGANTKKQMKNSLMTAFQKKEINIHKKSEPVSYYLLKCKK